MHRFAWPIVVATLSLAGCAQTPSGTADAGPNTPGWTGRTVVVGTNSTVAGDAQATDWSQKWGIGRQR